MDTGVIRMEFNGVFGVITRVVMTLLFLMFLIIGIRALIRSGKVAKDAERETEKKSDIERWFMETYNAGHIDEGVDPEAEDNDLYYERTDNIRQKISERFMDIDDSLMSALVDDIYAELFE